MWIPFKYEIRMKLDEGAEFQIGDIHTQQHLDHNPLAPPEFDYNNETLGRGSNIFQNKAILSWEGALPTFLTRLKEAREAPSVFSSNPEPDVFL